jgi:methyl-accepting chemotaxis protein
MIQKSFKRTFVLRFTVAVLAGMGLIAVFLYSVIPSSKTGQYAGAIVSFMKANDALAGVKKTAFLVESLVLSGVVVLVAMLASHKIAGPVYSLQRVLSELVNTRKARRVTFRSYDQLQGAAVNFNAMINGVTEHFRAIDDAYEEFERARKEIDNTPESVARLKEKVNNLGTAIERFSV